MYLCIISFVYIQISSIMVRVSLPNGKKKLSPNVVVVFVVVVNLADVGILVDVVRIIGILVVVVVVPLSLSLVSRVEVVFPQSLVVLVVVFEYDVVTAILLVARVGEAIVAMSVLPDAFVSVVFSVGLLGKPQKKILF